MLSRFTCMLALALFAAINSFGHALWIETSPVGKKGQAQEVRVFWGEFADKDISPLDKWFSDTKSYALSVITPDGKVLPLQSAPGKDHYKAYFTPDQDGAYTVVMKHVVRDVYHGSRLDYHSSAVVRVGTSAQLDAAANQNVLSVYTAPNATLKTGQNIDFYTLKELKPAGGQEVEVIAPNGWGKKLWADSTGKASFTPLWPGRYMVEVAGTKEEKGDHNGKAYEKIWRCATYCIEVK
ncbi:DUF4198 domain-containing protein [Chitinophaga sp.]|uniref:DUF4198 domain-containing protein n=1 Tax=Chitinophaga sp. TaxID=1869181 RepID=UPI002605C353|nr:DUF4198 domain-containing protein [uncultured Chitinophaga sp.]